MPTQTLTFKLVQAARKSGGDKYAASEDANFTIYVPQAISRASGKPHEQLTVTIQAGETETL